MIVVSVHGAQRIRERLGLPRSAIQRIANRAYVDGIPRTSIRGSLRAFLDSIARHEDVVSEVRVHAYNVYIFRDNTLVTIVPLPVKYKKTIDHIKEELRHA